MEIIEHDGPFRTNPRGSQDARGIGQITPHPAEQQASRWRGEARAYQVIRNDVRLYGCAWGTLGIKGPCWPVREGSPCAEGHDKACRPGNRREGGA